MPLHILMIVTLRDLECYAIWRLLDEKKNVKKNNSKGSTRCSGLGETVCKKKKLMGETKKKEKKTSDLLGCVGRKFFHSSKDKSRKEDRKRYVGHRSALRRNRLLPLSPTVRPEERIRQSIKDTEKEREMQPKNKKVHYHSPAEFVLLAESFGRH